MATVPQAFSVTTRWQRLLGPQNGWGTEEEEEAHRSGNSMHSGRKLLLTRERLLCGGTLVRDELFCIGALVRLEPLCSGTLVREELCNGVLVLDELLLPGMH